MSSEALIGQAAQELNRHADLDLRRTRVDVRLAGDGSGVTEQDVNLARRITDIAAAADAELECASLARVELALDTPDWRPIGAFWAAVLNGELVADGDWADVGDLNRVLPIIWFQDPAARNPGSAGTPTSGSTRANYNPGSMPPSRLGDSSSGAMT